MHLDRKFGECKLCRQSKPLIKAHVLSDLLYDGLFAEGHWLARVRFLKGTEQIVSTLPNGDYDRNILCNNCDGTILGQFETYASKIIRNEIEKAEPKNAGDFGKYISIPGVDYIKFKLFLLTQVWRASISKRPFFNNFNLGEHENIIREMIIKRDPGDETVYRTSIFKLSESNTGPTRIVAPPRTFGERGNFQAIIIVNKFLFIYNLNSEPNPQADFMTIKINNTLNIVLLDGDSSLITIEKLIGRKLRFSDEG